MPSSDLPQLPGDAPGHVPEGGSAPALPDTAAAVETTHVGTEAAVDAAAATPADSAPPSPRVEMSPAACAEQLRALFPALFAGPPKPIKLRIQSDIQARAPGLFTKPALSGFLRRLTGSTAYLIALTRAQQRFDLDGQPAGELSEEHRQAATTELARRRALHAERRQAEDDQRRERAQLLRAFETTTLTRENFCALKGLAPDALDALLAQARQEADERARQAPPPDRGGRRPGPPPFESTKGRPRVDSPPSGGQARGDRSGGAQDARQRHGKGPQGRPVAHRVKPT